LVSVIALVHGGLNLLSCRNFDKMSQATVSGWNSATGVYFVISVSFCIGLPNFFKIELPSAELWRHIHFSMRRPAEILDLIWVILDHPRSVINSSYHSITYEIISYWIG